MTLQQLLDSMASALSQVSAPLAVHQQIGSILRQAQDAVSKATTTPDTSQEQTND